MPLDISSLRLGGEWFCDNPECPHHVRLVQSCVTPELVNPRVTIEGNPCRVRRYTYISAKGEELHFCDWCKGAIDMTQGRYHE